MPTTNYIVVKVGRLPGLISEIALNGGRAVSDAIEAAGLDAEGYEVRVNGDPADLEMQLEEGDTLLLVKQVKGN